jgi:hypothetical protein
LREYLETRGVTPDNSDLIRCLWHDDDHPSCKVNDNYLYCFSCGAHGDIYEAAAAILGVPCDKEHFRGICQDIEQTLKIPAVWKLPKRKPGDTGPTIKLSQSAMYRDLLLKEFAAALDGGDMERAYYKAALLLALFMLPEGEPVQKKPKRDTADMLSSYGVRGNHG